MKVTININECVKVRLTEAGFDKHRKNYENSFKDNERFIADYKIPKVDEYGYTEFQLHELMEQFGGMLLMGSNLPFETDIVFEKYL